MGYYTHYEITIKDPKTLEDRLPEFTALREEAAEFKKLDARSKNKYRKDYIKRLQKAAKAIDSVSDDAWSSFDYTVSGERNKWYDYELDMSSISMAFPEFLFQVEGSGEESGDLWIKWFYRGQMQGGKAEIVLPKLDPKKWKGTS